MGRKDIIAEMHGKLCDQETGEPTGLNQFLDLLLQIKQAAATVLEDIPTIEELDGVKDLLIYSVHANSLRNLEEKLEDLGVIQRAERM